MPSQNIERFDQITAQVLGHLYQEFPLPTDLFPADFVGEASVYCEASCGDVPSQEARFFEACVQWLGDTGYLRYKEYLYYLAGFRGVVLTAKGLEVLKAIPDSLSGKQTIGEQLVSAAKAGATDLLKEGVKAALAQGAAMLGTVWN